MPTYGNGQPLPAPGGASKEVITLTYRNPATKYDPTIAEGRLLRKGEVIAITGLSETTLWRREQEGRFPARVRVTQRMTSWYASDVYAWLADPVGYRREVSA